VYNIDLYTALTSTVYNIDLYNILTMISYRRGWMPAHKYSSPILSASVRPRLSAASTSSTTTPTKIRLYLLSLTG